MSGVSGVQGVTPEGIVVDLESPAGRAMEAHGPAQRAIVEARRGGSLATAERALADLEDAVRGLPAGLAARYEPTIQELATAVGEARVDRARQTARPRRNDPIAAALGRGTSRFAQTMQLEPPRWSITSPTRSDLLVARLRIKALAT